MVSDGRDTRQRDLGQTVRAIVTRFTASRVREGAAGQYEAPPARRWNQLPATLYLVREDRSRRRGVLPSRGTERRGAGERGSRCPAARAGAHGGLSLAPRSPWLGRSSFLRSTTNP